MNSLSLKAAALVLLGAWQGAWGQVVTECAASGNGFDYEVIPEPGFSISWSMDTAAETISFQVISESIGWVSVGFSVDGFMIGSDAVVGLPDDLSVLEHEMTAKSTDGVVPFDDQEITEASVAQDAANGTTTVTFTRPLVPTGNKQPISSVPGDMTILVWAFGQDNELAYHGDDPFRGTVVLDLFCGDTVAAGTPSPAAAGSSAAPSGVLEASMAPTSAPTSAPTGVTGAPTLAGDDMDTPAPADGDRGIDTGSTAAPTEAADSLLMTPSPSSSLVDGDGQDTDGASRVGGGGSRWAAAAVAGVVTVLAALCL